MRRIVGYAAFAVFAFSLGWCFGKSIDAVASWELPAHEYEMTDASH